MASVHGKGTVVKVGNSAAVLTDISAYTNSEDLSRQADTAETTTFGANSKTYIPGLKDGTFSLSGVWDPALDGTMDGILGLSARAFEIYPAGSASGSVKYSGNAICTEYSGSNPVDDAASWSASFQISGDVTRSIVP
jgi:hypothetical protein